MSILEQLPGPRPMPLDHRAALREELETIAANPSRHRRRGRSQPRLWTRRLVVVAVAASIVAVLLVPLIQHVASPAKPVPATVPKTPRIGTQLAELKAFDIPAGDYFGSSVAISGTTAVIGAAGSKYAGRAYVFTKTAAGWTQVAELRGPAHHLGVANLGGAGDYFGEAVAISGSTIVVNARGQAYVFAKTAVGWIQAAVLRVGIGTPADQLSAANGTPVAISGNTIVVGSVSDVTAYVFTRAASGWKETAELRAPGNCYSLAFSGTTVVVGTTRNPTYFFTKTAAGWKQAGQLKGDGFTNASAVAISGATAVVEGEGRPSYGAGFAGVFTKTAIGWTQVAELKGNDSGFAISGSTIVVGISDTYDGIHRVFVFTKTTDGLRQVAEMDAPGLEAGPVAISGTTALVGTYLYQV